MIKHFGNDDVKDGIAEKLESFVAVAGCTTMRQCLFEQADVVETIVQRSLKPGFGLVQNDRSVGSRYALTRRFLPLLLSAHQYLLVEVY